MPKQGQSVESCILTELKKRKGDKVAVGDILFAYETDKASFEEESKFEGTVLEVFFKEGDEVTVLSNVMVIGQPGESFEQFVHSTQSDEPQTEQSAPIVEQSVESAAASVTVNSTVAVNASCGVSPRARALAQKSGIVLSNIAGTGPNGRIIERDVIAAIEGSAKMTPLAKAIALQTGAAAPQRGSGLNGTARGVDMVEAKGAVAAAEDSQIKPLSNMRKIIAKAMHASLQNSAQLTHHLGADARRIMELRKAAKKAAEEGRLAVNITLNGLVCFAVIKALQKFPNVNSHFLGDSMRLFSKVHLALAVDTERGLMVPVVKCADELTIVQLAERLKEVAAACKKGSIDPDLLSSEAASFTVSNLGNYGVEMFTPVINLPQSAILGVNTIVPRPKDIGGGVYAFVPHIGLSLTYDHRALDGGEATRFLKQIAIEIETLDIEF